MEFRFDDALPVLRRTPAVLSGCFGIFPSLDRSDGGARHLEPVRRRRASDSRRAHGLDPRVEHMLRHGDARRFSGIRPRGDVHRVRGAFARRAARHVHDVEVREPGSPGRARPDRRRPLASRPHPELGAVTLGQHLGEVGGPRPESHEPGGPRDGTAVLDGRGPMAGLSAAASDRPRRKRAMSVRVVRLGTPRVPGEGTRIGTVRAAAARRAESAVRRRELVRRVVPEPGSERRDHEARADGRVAGRVVGVFEEVQSRDGATGAAARPGAARRAVARDELLGRLLLRARGALPPLDLRRLLADNGAKVERVVLYLQSAPDAVPPHRLRIVCRGPTGGPS